MHLKRRPRAFKHLKAFPKTAFFDSSCLPETSISIIQDASICSLGFSDSLVRIINMLDPRSFVRLARSCKFLYNFCFNKKGIDVKYWGEEKTDLDFNTPNVAEENRQLDASGLKRHRLAICPAGRRLNQTVYMFKVNGISLWSGKRLRMRLQKMPFSFIIYELEIRKTVDDRFLAEMEEYLGRFPPTIIERIVTYFNIENVHGFYEFMKKFHTDSLFIVNGTLLPEETLLFMKNLSAFRYRGVVSDDHIIEATAKNLHLYGAKITMETFKRILQKFIAGEIHHWTLGISQNSRNLVFLFTVKELNIEAVKNLRDIEMKPSVIYYSSVCLVRGRTYGLLKADGSAGYFKIYWDRVEFGVKIFRQF